MYTVPVSVTTDMSQPLQNQPITSAPRKVGLLIHFSLACLTIFALSVVNVPTLYGYCYYNVATVLCHRSA